MRYRNNPYNIRYSDSNKWLGLIGNDNGFCTFSTLDCGIRAYFLILRFYALKFNIRTVRDIINRFAPSSENNVKAYLHFLAPYFTSLDVKLSEHDYLVLAYFMAIYESKTRISYEQLLRVWNYYHISNSNFP